MATLSFAAVENAGPSQDLHAWLAGDWALLFSHPEDFGYSGPFAQHQLTLLREEFAARAVRAVTVQPGTTREWNWIDQLNGGRQSICLREPPFTDSNALSFAARSLRGELLTLKSRYVLVIDGSLKRRGVLKYDARGSHVSPLELLASIDERARVGDIRRAA